MRRLVFLLLLLAGVAQAAGWRDYLESLKKRQRGRQRPAVAGVRGWNADAAAKDTDGRDYAGVDGLDRLQPSDSEVEAFAKEGGLAP